MECVDRSLWYCSWFIHTEKMEAERVVADSYFDEKVCEHMGGFSPNTGCSNITDY